MPEISSIFFLMLMGVAILLWQKRDKQSPRQTTINPNIIAKNTPQEEKAPGNDLQLLVQVLLIEYESVREEFLKRVDISSQVQSYSVLLLSATILLVEYIDFANSNGNDAYFLYLLMALVFCSIGWYQLDADDKAADMDNYILLSLTPYLKNILEKELSQTINVQNLLGWHFYWRNTRYKSTSGFWLSLGVLGRSGIPVLSAAILLGSYIYLEHIVLGLPWHFPQIFLVSTVIFGIIWMLIAGSLVRKKLVIATEAYRATINNV